MTLNWNEIKNRAISFSKEWANTSNEEADAKPFLDAFFDVFGISRRKVGTFEHRVKKLNDKDGYIDLLWKQHILVEMKSLGKDLDKAFLQAKDYALGLPMNELPKYILVCDFNEFRLYDTEEQTTNVFMLNELYNNVALFGYLIGLQKKAYKEQDPANIKAAELMGKLHDRLEEIGYIGHPLEVYLVRILFLLFAEDTTIFNKQQFQDYIEQRTSIDGSDLASKLQELFQVLNTPKENRFKNLDEQLDDFPYVNGKLFEEILPMASFDSKMRQALLNCCYIDWSKISPAIFGSMFQSVMNPKERRNLGAHYTSETNILKLIKPLFLDDLWKEFESIKDNKNKLPEFHKKLSTLKFLDPACGCGNFLVITYRELRLLEIEILRALNKSGQRVIDVRDIIWLDVDMMCGIEYEEFPARIAEVAMWLIDHQMNMLISNEFGQYFVRLPLKKSAKIVHGNALETNWHSLLNSPSERGLGGVIAGGQASERELGGVKITPQYLLQNGINPNGLIFSELYLPYNPNSKENSKALRKAGNLSEVLLWKKLRANQFLGYSFYRQKPLLHYIADFYCKELNLVIEIDGKSHHTDEATIYDAERDRQMQVIGLTVLRINDRDVRFNMGGVLELIEHKIRELNGTSLTPPSPLKEGEFGILDSLKEGEFGILDSLKERGLGTSISPKEGEFENTNYCKEMQSYNPIIPRDGEQYFDYILGNPPFIGSKIMSQNQRDAVIKEFDNIQGAGVLDYVTAWYIKAAKYIQGTKTKVAFVSTNSIVQGEQTSILWGQMLNKYNIKIHFAHRTFKWRNEAKGNAAVYCVIIGFANYDTTNKTIFEYEDIKGEAHEIKAKNINPYLVDAKDFLIDKRTKPLCNVQSISKGNQPTEGGNLIMSKTEKDELVSKYPILKNHIKALIGAEEFLYNKPRYCFWFPEFFPPELRSIKELSERLRLVQEMRKVSTDPKTRELANEPYRFREMRNYKSFVIIPSHTSENRRFIPIGFGDENLIPTNATMIIPNGTLYHFGILMSTMHMTWVSTVCGRLKSDYRYSKDIVYNNYPWPENPSEKSIKSIEEKAQKVLDARLQFPSSSLADLYDPLTMPPVLVKAHQELDKAVDLCYRPQPFINAAKRIEFLFELYEKYTADLFTIEKVKKLKKKS